jgi:hypothetical protein
VVGFAALVIAGQNQVKTEATKVTGEYLDALIKEDYPTAYALLCDAMTGQQPEADFAATQRDRIHPRSYRLGQPSVGETSVTVPAQVRYADGQERTENYRLLSEETAGPLRVCGTTG